MRDPTWDRPAVVYDTKVYAIRHELENGTPSFQIQIQSQVLHLPGAQLQPGAIVCTVP